ncbi:hypothetical protein UFOVP1304_26 [uncultured Caudovirales phage]|uniref:Uncharacterized protein n=1 Tax=uncultured Caudovirales phage TaxID=2100421 RepID=A0A6J5RM91_9CAUD|nr:hypothetical protein UFOVP1304_26 [uncultured Caudovirales phage]
MRYAAYVETGQIIQWGIGEPPMGATYIEHNHEGSLADYYVTNGELAIKPQMDLAVTDGTPADGVSEAVISGLPVGTAVTLFISGAPSHYVIDDGQLEVSVYDAQVVPVTLWHPIYRHDLVELVFV